MSRAAAGAGLLLLVLARTAAAEEPPQGPEPALEAAGAALRARLPVPGQAWEFGAPLLFEGFRVGAVRVRAEPTSVGGKPAWRVLERTLREAGEGRVLTEFLYDLAPDLTLLSGECLVEASGGRSRTHVAWRAGRLVCVAADAPARRQAEHVLPASTSLGLFAAARLAALLPAEAGAKAWLPAFDPRFAFGDEDGEQVPSDLAHLNLESLGRAGARRTPDGDREMLRVRAGTRYGRAFTLLLDAESRELLEVEGDLPRFTLRPGVKAEPPPWFQRVGQTPGGPLDVFVSFGRGYHTADRALLEATIHWPSLREREIAAGTYPPDVTLERVREEWIAEFLAQSKRRTPADCDDLLLQLLSASPLVRRDDGSCHLATPAAFGGHGYHLAERDGRWWILGFD